MIHGVKVINGKILVKNYDNILDVPQDEVSKRPEEVLDYIEELLRKK